MLAEDAPALAELGLELEGLVAHFAAREPATARFLRVILAMLRHAEPERADLVCLRPDYAQSFTAMFALIEDAGWSVRRGARRAAACAALRARGSRAHARD
jgi:hypothetical protein